MTEPAPPVRPVHPILFLIMFLPLGVSNGYVVVTLAYLLSHAGVSVQAIAGLVARGADRASPSVRNPNRPKPYFL